MNKIYIIYIDYIVDSIWTSLNQAKNYAHIILNEMREDYGNVITLIRIEEVGLNESIHESSKEVYVIGHDILTNQDEHENNH